MLAHSPHHIFIPKPNYPLVKKRYPIVSYWIPPSFSPPLPYHLLPILTRRVRERAFWFLTPDQRTNLLQVLHAQNIKSFVWGVRKCQRSRVPADILRGTYWIPVFDRDGKETDLQIIAKVRSTGQIILETDQLGCDRISVYWAERVIEDGGIEACIGINDRRAWIDISREEHHHLCYILGNLPQEIILIILAYHGLEIKLPDWLVDLATGQEKFYVMPDPGAEHVSVLVNANLMVITLYGLYPVKLNH